MAEPISFLVIGAGRGGTSLLATSLDAHPELTVGFERWAVAILLGGLPSWVGRGESERIAGFLDGCRADAREAATRLWGNKITTEQLAGVAPDRAALDALLSGQLRDIPVVAILRDGRACVRSKMRRAGVSLEEACRRWLFSVSVVEALEASDVPTHVLRYEDLVRTPVPTLTGVCGFLGVPFHPALLTGTQSEQMPREYRRDGFDTSALAAGLELPDEWEELLAPALQARGYG